MGHRRLTDVYDHREYTAAQRRRHRDDDAEQLARFHRFHDEHAISDLPSVAKEDQLVGIPKLRELSGCSAATIKRLSSSGVIPGPVAHERGMPLFDLANPKLAGWCQALQKAGYSRRPVGAK